MSAAAPLYEIRSPEQTILYSVVASELETFLAEQRSAEHEVPRFVEREFRAFLGCGVLPRGFLRVHCGSCGMDAWSGSRARDAAGAPRVAVAAWQKLRRT
jgi:hypothetical protein